MLSAVAGLAALVLAATGCAGEDASSRRDGPEPVAGQGGRGADQGSPAAAAESYFEAVRDARFGDACALLAPVARARYASAGQDCSTAMAGLFDEATRAAIGDVAADESKVDIVGDTATVPGDALTRADLPQGAPDPSIPAVKATRYGDGWYLVP